MIRQTRENVTMRSGHFGKLRDAEHRQIVERVKVVFRFADTCGVVARRNFGVRKPDFRDHAAEVRVRIAKLADEIDHLAVIESEAGEVLIGLDVIGQVG